MKNSSAIIYSVFSFENGSEICPKCDENHALQEHPCPYKMELENDRETMCVCCKSCRNECARDV